MVRLSIQDYLIETKKQEKIIFVLLITYFLLNLIFLTNYPFIHSDESWLSGLSRNIMEKKDFSVTETFFDLYPRNPHAIKSVFHLIQIIFIKVLGYSIFSVRLISLLAGTATLYYFYRLSLVLFQSQKLSIFGTSLLGLDIQFIYASHFARQEIILLLVLISGLYLLFKKISDPKTKFHRSFIFIGCIVGIGIGIHPNSLIIALSFLFIQLYHLMVTKKLKAREFLSFILTLTIFATIFIVLSLSFDPDFFHNYLRYGETLGILNPLNTKANQLDYFYIKLYHGVSGTYYTPDIKPQFYLFGSVLLLTIIKTIFNKDRNIRQQSITIILSLLATNLGYILIGRYNQTSIIFLFPLFYLLILWLFKISNLNKANKALNIILAIALLIVISFNTGLNLISGLDINYDNYLKEISSAITRDAVVLANLNCEYYFDNGKLYDYRNLDYLEEYRLTFREYIQKNRIEYIIYPEEMDYIYNSRPRWNGLYGNVAYYYEDMKDFFQNNCLLIHEFDNATYGIRIARYVGRKDWKIRIYRVVN